MGLPILRVFLIYVTKASDIKLGGAKAERGLVCAAIASRRDVMIVHTSRALWTLWTLADPLDPGVSPVIAACRGARAESGDIETHRIDCADGASPPPASRRIARDGGAACPRAEIRHRAAARCSSAADAGAPA